MTLPTLARPAAGWRALVSQRCGYGHSHPPVDTPAPSGSFNATRYPGEPRMTNETEQPYVVNPEAIGNPDIDPIVRVPGLQGPCDACTYDAQLALQGRWIELRACGKHRLTRPFLMVRRTDGEEMGDYTFGECDSSLDWSAAEYDADMADEPIEYEMVLLVPQRIAVRSFGGPVAASPVAGIGEPQQ